MGVHPVLPVPGVSFILGNDLAGERVLPALDVDHPISFSETDELAQNCPVVFPTCLYLCSRKVQGMTRLY